MSSKKYTFQNGTKVFIPIDINKNIQPISVSDLKEVVESFPNVLSKYIEEIEIVDYRNPQDFIISQIYGIDNFRSSAVGGFRKITFFPGKNNRTVEQIKNIMYHECGHILEDEFYKETGILINESNDYQKAVKFDEKKTGKMFISKYAEASNSYREDVADSIKYYYLYPKYMENEFKGRTKFIKEWIEWIKKK